MCENIYKAVNVKTFTGYKYALQHKKTGVLRSPATFVVYRPGKVPRPKNKVKIYKRDKSFDDTILDRNSDLFNKKMYGMTSVFSNIEDAIERVIFEKSRYNDLPKNYFPVLIKMVISMQDKGDLFEGSYGSPTVYLGDHIDKIKVLPFA